MLSRNKERRALLGLLALGLAALPACDRESLREGPSAPAVVPPPPPPPPPPPCSALPAKINEVMVLNGATLEDEDGNFPPWIEIYNNSDTDLNLAGVPVSDSLAEPGKWIFPNVPESMVPARGFVVVFCDGDTEDEFDLHASFTLAPGPLQLLLNGGCDLFFFDASGLGVDQSAGRVPDGGSIAVLAEPTPGASNSPEDGGGGDADFLRADAGGDGRVNVNDMILILRVLFQGEPAPSCEDRLDADDSGVVDLTDPLYIGAALFQDGPPIPLPFPDPGPDPTADGLSCPADD